MKMHTYLNSTMIKKHRPYGTFGAVIIASYHNYVPLALKKSRIATKLW
jgi:hypothetical protein